MICPTCGKPTTNHLEGKPSPCNGCTSTARQQLAEHQADREARFSKPVKRRFDLGDALQKHRKRHRHPSDLDRKPVK